MARSTFAGRCFRLLSVGVLLTLPVACGEDSSDNGGGTTGPETEPGFVSGVVQDTSGSGISDAELRLVQGSDALTQTSAANGAYFFDNVAAGTWTLGVTPPDGYELAEGQAGSFSITVAESDTINADPFVVNEAPPPSATVDTVTINLTSSFSFSPANVTIQEGDYIRWEDNVDGINHTVTSDDNVWASQIMSNGNVFVRQFTSAGSYPYYCQPHGGPGGQGMSGTITVE